MKTQFKKNEINVNTKLIKRKKMYELIVTMYG
jgi:hypothetical protein